MAGIDNNTILYLRGDSFEDLSKNKIEIVNNGVTLINDGNFGKCFSFKNSSTFMYFVSDLFNFGTEDFTIEFFVKLNDTHSYHPLFMSGVSGTQGELTKCSIYECRNDYGGTLGTSGTKTIDSFGNYANIWIYVAMVRKDNVLKFYLDGKSTGDGKTQTYNLQNTRYSIGKDLWYPNNYFNGAMYNLRISNVSRYTKDFTPPTQPFNTIDIDVTNQTKDKIDFNISKLGQEVVNKIEILVNGQVFKTYDNIGDLTCDIDKSLLFNGNNKIKIKVTFDNDYTEEKEIDYEYVINNLPTLSSLKELIDRQELLTNSIEIQKNTLKSILESKNVEVSEGENKLSILIQKVDELGEIIPPLYLYKEGDECINLTGGFIVYKNNSNATPVGIFSKNTDYLELDATKGYASCGTTNKINVSEYKTLYIDSSTDTSNAICCLTTAQNLVTSNRVVVMETTKNGRGVTSIDISNVNDLYYLAIGLGTSLTKVHKIWLEK